MSLYSQIRTALAQVKMNCSIQHQLADEPYPQIEVHLNRSAYLKLCREVDCPLSIRIRHEYLCGTPYKVIPDQTASFRIKGRLRS